MKTNRKFLLPIVLSAALALSACGGGGDGGGAAPTPPDISLSVSALLDFMRGLVAGTSETSDPIDINALTLAVDDTAEPSPL